MYLESKTKRIFVIACLEKSSFLNRKNRLFYFAYSIFENIEILSDQGVVQNQTKLGREYPNLT